MRGWTSIWPIWAAMRSAIRTALSPKWRATPAPRAVTCRRCCRCMAGMRAISISPVSGRRPCSCPVATRCVRTAATITMAGKAWSRVCRPARTARTCVRCGMPSSPATTAGSGRSRWMRCCVDNLATIRNGWRPRARPAKRTRPRRRPGFRACDSLRPSRVGWPSVARGLAAWSVRRAACLGRPAEPVPRSAGSASLTTTASDPERHHRLWRGKAYAVSMPRDCLQANVLAGMLPCSWSPQGRVGENAVTLALAGSAKTSPCAIPCLSLPIRSAACSPRRCRTCIAPKCRCTAS
ncbi:hypothetical protein XHV734_4562 [Xanthomonas hortorum pv. vitians]|nr:hypothetical protein XHV734_4562 [Xanthomonas hortorum pv. vitians]